MRRQSSCFIDPENMKIHLPINCILLGGGLHAAAGTSKFQSNIHQSVKEVSTNIVCAVPQTRHQMPIKTDLIKTKAWQFGIM